MPVQMIYQTTLTQYQYIHSTLLSVLESSLEKKNSMHVFPQSTGILTRWELSMSFTLSSEHLLEFPENVRSQSHCVIENNFPGNP